MEINFSDYLTEEEQKEIVKECFKDQCKESFKNEKNLQRIIFNQAYNIVWKMVDEVFDNSLENLLKEKVKIIIEGLSEFTIFKKPDAWDREPNNAYNFLQKCIEENFSRIKQIVDENIDKETLKELKIDINDRISECVSAIYKEI